MVLDPYYAPDFQVKVEGLTLQADITQSVISLSYDSSADVADMFSLQLNNADLSLTDSALFDVGKTVEIHMGYVGNLHPMMLGEITAVSPSFPEGGAPTLTVTGYDKSHRLRHNQGSKLFVEGVNDSAVAAQIAAQNFLIPVVDPAPYPPRNHPQGGSDWALLKELARRNFFELNVHWDKLYFRFPRPQTEMIVLERGKNLNSFSPRLSTSGQAGIQVVRGYDHQLAQNILVAIPALTLGSDLDNMVERLGSSFVDKLISLGKKVAHHESVNGYIEAGILAESLLRQLLEGLYEGSGSCVGIPELRAGKMIEVRGVGKRFSGKYRLSKVNHTINQSGYQCRFEISQKDNYLLQSLRHKVEETDPPNQQPTISGVVVGTVDTNLDLDPEGPGLEGKVRVSLHGLDTSVWARVATLMAGDGKGTYFLPDPGDDVLVAFKNGNINDGYIIGSLWNGVAQPIERNLGLNEKKIIQTKTGMQLMFDETPGQETVVVQAATASPTGPPPQARIRLQTGEANSLEMTQQTGTVAISANQGNTLELAPTGVTAASDTGITLNVGSGTSTVEVTPDAITAALGGSSVEITADGITITGSSSITLQVGGSSIELTPAAVNIQGTTINLN